MYLKNKIHCIPHSQLVTLHRGSGVESGGCEMSIPREGIRNLRRRPSVRQLAFARKLCPKISSIFSRERDRENARVMNIISIYARVCFRARQIFANNITRPDLPKTMRGDVFGECRRRRRRCGRGSTHYLNTGVRMPSSQIASAKEKQIPSTIIPVCRAKNMSAKEAKDGGKKNVRFSNEGIPRKR